MRTGTLTKLFHLAIVASLIRSLDCTRGIPRYLRGYYMGWIGHANLGDELVLDIFGHLLRDSLFQLGSFKRVSLEYEEPTPQEQHAQSFDFNNSFDFAVLGGGSLLEAKPNYRTLQCQGVRDARLRVYVHGTGTQLPYEAVVSLQNLRCVRPPVWGGVRGPLTNNLLGFISQHYGREPYKLPVFSDSGILADRFFPRISSGATVRRLSSAMQNLSNDSFVLCVSGAVQSGIKGTPGFMDTVDLMAEWTKQHIVVLLPVDPHTVMEQQLMYSKLLERDPSIAGRLLLSTDVNKYEVWLALLSRCDLLFSVRLHAAVMAAAVGTPFIVLDSDELPLLAKKTRDFLLGTVGGNGGREGNKGRNFQKFIVPQKSFDGSLSAISALQRDVAAWWPVQKESFDRAIPMAYTMYTNSMKDFLAAVMPRSFWAFTDVGVKIERFFDAATLELRFS